MSTKKRKSPSGDSDKVDDNRQEEEETLKEAKESKTNVIIIGVDEVGVGSLAGPLYGCACYCPPDNHVDGVRDSKQIKQLSERIHISDALKEKCVYAFSVADAQLVDEINNLQARLLCMYRATVSLCKKLVKQQIATTETIFHVWVDGDKMPPYFAKNKQFKFECKTMVKGDSRSYSIAAASVLAKVERDNVMLKYHEEFPLYNFNTNVGYPTKGHRDALMEHGPCAIHRKTFGPVAAAIEKIGKAKKDKVKSM